MEKSIAEKKFYGNTEEIAEICCNIDDMTGEEIGFALDRLLENGALEVYTTPVGMKKNRPGVLLTVLTTLDEIDKFIEIILTNTTTIGVRWHKWQRTALERTYETLKTEYGTVGIKKSEGYGVTRNKAEYDDMVKIAKERGLTLKAVEEAVEMYLKERKNR